MKNVVVFLVGLTSGLALMFAYHWRQARDAVPSPSAASSTGERLAPRPASLVRADVVALGTIEPKNGIVNVASPLVGHRIEALAAKPGVLFPQGRLLVQLDAAADEVELKLVEVQLADAQQRQGTEVQRAKQALSAAELTLAQLRGSREMDLALQEARRDVLVAKQRQAEADLGRLRQLRDLSDSLVAEQQVEQQAVLVDVAQSEAQAGEIDLKKLQQSLDFQLEAAEAERLAAEQSLRLAESGSGIKTLEQQRRLAEIKLQQTRVLAPITGTVLNVFAHAGEVVSQSPLLQIADLNDLVCLAEVDATDLSRLSVGQKARVSSRAFRGPFPDTTVEAVVERFGSLVARAALRPLDPRQPVDRHVVQVVVAVDAKAVLARIFGDDAQDPAALVGLQVEVRFPESPAERTSTSP